MKVIKFIFVFFSGWRDYYRNRTRRRISYHRGQRGSSRRRTFKNIGRAGRGNQRRSLVERSIERAYTSNSCGYQSEMAEDCRTRYRDSGKYPTQFYHEKSKRMKGKYLFRFFFLFFIQIGRPVEEICRR